MEDLQLSLYVNLKGGQKVFFYCSLIFQAITAICACITQISQISLKGGCITFKSRNFALFDIQGMYIQSVIVASKKFPE